MKKDTCLLFALMWLAFGCNPKKEIAEEVTSKLGKISPTLVSVKIVEERPFEFLMHTSGKIRPQIGAEIFVKSDGLVKKLMVANGDFVSNGQALAELENDKQK